MSTFSKQISIRWADLDPNFHLRHSVYYDLGSQFRMELLEEAGCNHFDCKNFENARRRLKMEYPT